jgi:sensor domain CHASE-containing protein
MPRKTLNNNSSFKQGFGWAPVYIAISVLGIIVTAVILYFAEQRKRTADIAQARTELQYELNQAATDLSLTFQRNADTISAVAALISIEPDISFERFAAFSEEIFVDHSDFLKVAVAPDLVVDRVYPKSENGSLLNFDYRAAGNEEKMANVLRARKAQSVLFTGPAKLADGRVGIVAHDVVYVTGEDGTRKFWGLLNLVIDHEEALRQLGLHEVSYRLALRG